MRRFLRACRRRFNNASIAQKYGLAIVLLTVTLVLCAAYVCAQSYRATYNDRIAQAQSSFTDRYEACSRFEKRMLHLASMFQHQEQTNQALASTERFTVNEHLHNKQQLWQLLYTMLDSSGDYTCRVYANPALGLTDETSLILSLDAVRAQPWAQEALTGWGWWRFRSAADLGASAPALIAPIRNLTDYQDLIAILRIDLQQEALGRMLALPADRPYLACYLESADGQLIYATDEGMTRVPVAELDRETVVGFAAARLNSLRWQERTLYYQSLPYSRWRCALVVDEQALLRDLLPDYLTYSLIGVLMALCGILFALPVIWTTAVRIRRFHRYVQEMGQSEIGRRLEPLSGDEVGQLIVAHNHLLDRIQALMTEREAKDRELRRLEIAALQAQIKPHFLYNTLEAISWMARRDEGEKAEQVIRSLTRFYRLCLSGGADELTVEKELEIVRHYVDIQRFRYHDVFRLEVDVAADALPLRLPKITLQPLVENALMHGILESGQAEGVVRVYSRVSEAGVCELCIADSGGHFTPEDWQRALRTPPAEGAQEGYGLMNVERRLCLLMGVPGVLYLDERDPAWTCIVLPFLRAEPGA